MVSMVRSNKQITNILIQINTTLISIVPNLKEIYAVLPRAAYLLKNHPQRTFEKEPSHGLDQLSSNEHHK